MNIYHQRTLHSTFHLLTSIVSIAPPPPAFSLLRPDYVQDALYNSAKRWAEHAVICQPDTQDQILRAIRSWADRMDPRVCWLSGPAGTGKTTIAHTIAKEYDERGQLAATFFFWKKTGDRDDINKVVPTLAYQVAGKVPSAKERMEEILILTDSSQVPLSQLSLEDQLSKLLITNFNPTDPNLIVIDGLDECASLRGICQLIEWIRKNKSPFRFLLTSRPEPEIRHRMSGGYDVQILTLTESKEDIRNYFVEHLENVWPKQQHSEDGGPLQWPSADLLAALVVKSEGLFVYAATAVRYIGGEGSPQTRLKDVLNLYTGLDYLYAQVIKEAKKWDYFDTVMGSIMYLRYQLGIDDLSRILLALNEHLTSSDIRIALRRCHSILVIPNDNSGIKLCHASLRDFLTDQSRSETLFQAPAICHGRLMFGCLSEITRAFSDGTCAPQYAVVSWYYHACFFLSTGGPGEGLQEMKDRSQELFNLFMKIDLNWVKLWMSEALLWAGVPYLRGNLLTKV